MSDEYDEAVTSPKDGLEGPTVRPPDVVGDDVAAAEAEPEEEAPAPVPEPAPEPEPVKTSVKK